MTSDDPNSGMTPSTKSNAPTPIGRDDPIPSGIYRVGQVWTGGYLSASGSEAIVTPQPGCLACWAFIRGDSSPQAFFWIKNLVSTAYLGYVGDFKPCTLNANPGDDHKFRWTLEKHENGWVIRSLYDPGQILEVSGKDQVTVETWEDKDQTNQRWSLISDGDLQAIPAEAIRAHLTPPNA